MSQKEIKEKENEKRRLSSDCQTSKESTKMSKMAQCNSGDPDFESKLIDQMTIIADAIDRLQKGRPSCSQHLTVNKSLVSKGISDGN